MIVRRATVNDAESIAPILILVLENMIYRFIGENDYDKAKFFLIHFLKKENNQYSYQNCFVAELNNTIVGVINIYKGADLIALRQPILDFSNQHYNISFPIEDETQAGEYYIDTIAVVNKWQGKGIGTKLLRHAIDHFVINMNQTLGLLVDEKNPKAKKLYLNLEFKSVGKKELLGHHMAHLQITSLP